VTVVVIVATPLSCMTDIGMLAAPSPAPIQWRGLALLGGEEGLGPVRAAAAVMRAAAPRLWGGLVVVVVVEVVEVEVEVVFVVEGLRGSIALGDGRLRWSVGV
jgi:hypothetical protein